MRANKTSKWVMLLALVMAMTGMVQAHPANKDSFQVMETPFVLHNNVLGFTEVLGDEGYSVVYSEKYKKMFPDKFGQVVNGEITSPYPEHVRKYIFG